MRKLFTLAVVLLSFSLFSNASILPLPEKDPLKADEIFLPFGKNGELISLYDFSLIKISAFQEFSGQRLSLKERIAFRSSQKQIQKFISSDRRIRWGILGLFRNHKTLVPFIHSREKAQRRLRLSAFWWVVTILTVAALIILTTMPV